MRYLEILEHSEQMMTLWHGGRGLHMSYNELRPSAKGQWEYGPGIYLTTHYETAAKYSKGGGRVFRVTVRKGVEINSVNVALEDAIEFVKRYAIKRFQKDIISYLEQSLNRRGLLPIVNVVNLCLNYRALTTANTVALRKFIIDHGVDYEISKGFGGRGSESLVIVYNPKCIVSVQMTSASDIKSEERVQTITEAPIADMGSYGSSEPGSFNAQDLRATKNPKWIEKTTRMFSKCPFNFNIFFYNADEEKGLPSPTGSAWKIDPKRFQHVDLFHKGRASRQYVEKLLGRTDVNFDEEITLLLVDNEGNERFPLSPWIVAHRAVHMMMNATVFGDHILGEGLWLRTHISDMLSEAGIKMKGLEISKLIGSTAAQRTGNLANSGEFTVEAGTQYIVQGRVQFRKVSHPDIPDDLAKKIDAFVEEETVKLNELFQQMCEYCVGLCLIL